MTALPNNSDAPWVDLLRDDIPVIDIGGKRLLVRGSLFVDPAVAAAEERSTRGEQPPAKPAQDAATAPPPTAAAATVNAAAARPIPSKAAPPPLNLPVAPVDVPAETAQAPAPTDTAADAAADAAEVAAAAKRIQEKKIDAPAESREVLEMEEAVRRAVIEANLPPTGPDAARRFELLVSLYFRDLRDALETKSKFTMPVASGGMGMGDADAERVITLLKGRREAYRAAHAGVAADAKASFVAERTEKVLNRQVRIDEREDQKREEAFNGIVARTGIMPAATPAAPAPASAAPQPQMPPKPSAPRAVPVMAEPSTAAPVTIPSKAEPPRNASGTLVPPSPVLPTVGRPVLADVAPAPRLTGPVEEIRSITLADFRRLSRDPSEATLKIRDKIDLLQEHSFDTKTQGIRAWTESVVNKQYLDLLRTSLEGKPVTDVIADREKAGVPTLTKPEFDAIMALNRTLRFG